MDHRQIWLVEKVIDGCFDWNWETFLQSISAVDLSVTLGYWSRDTLSILVALSIRHIDG